MILRSQRVQDAQGDKNKISLSYCTKSVCAVGVRLRSAGSIVTDDEQNNKHVSSTSCAAHPSVRPCGACLKLLSSLDGGTRRRDESAETRFSFVSQRVDCWRLCAVRTRVHSKTRMRTAAVRYTLTRAAPGDDDGLRLFVFCPSSRERLWLMFGRALPHRDYVSRRAVHLQHYYTPFVRERLDA